MKVPTISELAMSMHNDLIRKEEELVTLKLNPLNSYIVDSRKEEIKEIKEILVKYKAEIREEKLKTLGIF